MIKATEIAAIQIAGGETAPFYAALLRIYYKKKSSDLVVKDVGGLRVLLADAEVQSVKNGGAHQAHLPMLLRAYVRPEDKEPNAGLKLALETKGGVKEGKLLPDDSAYDVVLTPIGGWPQNLGPEIDLPSMRLVEGGVTVRLVASPSNDLVEFFRFSGGRLFDGFRLDDSSASHIDLRLHADGLEFKGSLPDPTRDLLTPAEATARISGVFRLERGYDAASKQWNYRLRLVGGDPIAMDRLEARIARAFGDLASEGSSPLAVRFDRRPNVPPLLWPLEDDGKRLSLRRIAGLPDDFEMTLDPSAIDVRIRTTSNFPGDAEGVAAVHDARLSWLKAIDGFGIDIAAGKEPEAPQVVIDFERREDHKKTDGWMSKLRDSFDATVRIPLDDVNARLLAVYAAGRVVAPDATQSPYAFFPLAEGWLQLGLDTLAKITQPPPPTAASIISGRIAAAHGNSPLAPGPPPMRGVVIDGAAQLKVSIPWRTQAGRLAPRSATLTIGQARGQFRGFIFVAETAPTAAEALPDLRRGPAATRDVPISFNSDHADDLGLALRGKFNWSAAGWTLAIDDIVEIVLKEKDKPAIVAPTPPAGCPQGVIWRAPTERPFITNHPLTRSAVTPAEPSVSRGLVPREFTGAFTLGGAATGDAPVWKSSEPTEPMTECFKGSGREFAPDTLILPTLPGVEFVTDGKGLLERAALRHDLPILDELYAWSDPPPPKPKGAPPPKPAPLVVTAIDPDGLKKVWTQNRARMALTRTQQAFMTGWQNVGTSQSAKIETLVEPFVWTAPLVIEVSSRWGSYSLDGKLYALDGALAGLDQNFRAADRVLAADKKNEQADGAKIAVRGQAANLFDMAGLKWDSRGAGMASVARSGVRPAGRDGDKVGDLRTLTAVKTMAIAATKLTWMDAEIDFYVRDLLVTNNVFNFADSPAESAGGTTGQAFDRKNFLGSLHEWRLFEHRASDTNVPPKPFDIRFGPFLFRPLRLRHVTFENDEPTVIEILGGMSLGVRLKPDENYPTEGPFGADRVYQRSDLLVLTLTRDTGTWTPHWQGFQPKPHAAGTPAPSPIVTTRLALTVDGKGIGALIDGARAEADDAATIEAVIRLDIATATVEMSATLFGRRCLFKTDAEFEKDRIGFKIAAAGSAAKASTALLNIKEIKVAIGPAANTICFDGALSLLAAPANTVTAKNELARFDVGAMQWLDLSSNVAAKNAIAIDHRSGRISVARREVIPAASPLLGMKSEHAWDFDARIEAFTADDANRLTSLAPLAIGTAWGRITAIEETTRHRIDHRLLLDAGALKHDIEVSCKAEFTSPIEWPADGLTRADGFKICQTWLTPSAANSATDNRSREIAITPTERLTHKVTLNLRRHPIAANNLRRPDKRISPVSAINLLAVVQHKIGGQDKQVNWTSLDYVTIATLGQLVDTAENSFGIAARYPWPKRKYRGANTSTKVAHPGIVALPWAVSGVFDQALIDHCKSNEQMKDVAVVLGGSALLLANPKSDDAVLAVMPWMGFPDDQWPADTDNFTLTQSGGRWRVAAPDLWSGALLAGAMSRRAIALPSTVDAGQALTGLGRSGLLSGEADLARLPQVTPVEQVFFENLDGNGAISKADLGKAPFFLRALLAIQTLWKTTTWKDEGKTIKTAEWKALSLHPVHGAEAGSSGTGAIAVAIKTTSEPRSSVAPALAAAPPAKTLVPADLIVLSRGHATRVVAYRVIAPDLADDDSAPRAELIARGRDVDRFAACVIRETDREGDLPAIVVVPVPRGIVMAQNDDGSTIDHQMLAPSPALGWPTASATVNLDRLAPQLGGECPVLAREAGFAARFRQIGLPGSTAKEMRYLGFANRVIFERGAGAPFNGPAARHLSPVNTRLRAPTADETFGTPETASLAETARPVLSPFYELATIGRRPGVLEAVSTSVVVVPDENPFDASHGRFGRPANSGPVVAHQLRNPRSPPLPDDAADAALAPAAKTQNASAPPEILKFRRRTYVSLLDLESDGSLSKFYRVQGAADVMRPQADQPFRLMLSIDDRLIGPDWDGRLTVTITARAAGTEDLAKLLEQTVATFTARVEIGAASFALSATGAAANWPACEWTLQLAATSLGAARDQLVTATADTPLRLVVTNGGNAPLAPAPRLTAILPLGLKPVERRVLMTQMQTIAFGDPSYDRQLGSAVETDIKQIGKKRVMFAVDRPAYDTGATLYFACGEIDPDTGLFATATADAEFNVRFRHLRAGGPNGIPRTPDDLVVAAMPPNSGNAEYRLRRGTPYEIALQQLRLPQGEGGDICPLSPGDRLEITATPHDTDGTRPLTLSVDIVAAAIIAPPPCVYSVIETAEGATSSQVVLHAAAPMPQHIEFPNLRDDLAKGYVNRRALFVWRFARIGQNKTNLELIKYDRSGGAQLPASSPEL